MAVISTLSNHFKKQLAAGAINFTSDTVKIALMSGEFAFDKDAHATWANVSASELGNGNGYTTGGQVLVAPSFTEDDVNDRGEVTWGVNPKWNATGELKEFGAAVVFDDTSSDDTVVGCIDFGTTVALEDGTFVTITAVTVRLS